MITAKKLEPDLQKVLQDVNRLVYFIKTRTGNIRTFTILCNDRGETMKILYTCEGLTLIGGHTPTKPVSRNLNTSDKDRLQY